MEKLLIFLLFISYVSNLDCIGGISIRDKCVCPRGFINSNGRCVRQIVRKPVIYLYPEESMDISVQLNLKESKFTTVYPKFNGKNTWNVHAKPNGDILIKDLQT